LAVGAAGAAALIPDTNVVAAAAAVLVISLGYDLTQPLLAGIVTDIGGPQAAGRAMGLNVFILFTGFGVGATCSVDCSTPVSRRHWLSSPPPRSSSPQRGCGSSAANGLTVR
jgi:predicted lipid-binding transport protein (Tim44 family)